MPYLYVVIQEFKKNIEERKLLPLGKKYYLAISGGADSVALACLLRDCNIPFELLHVNYGLRGPESDEDEDFVRALGKKWKVKVHVYQAKEEILQAVTGISIQMKARAIRYQWFETFCKTAETVIITAHQMNDRVENFFLRIVRGSRGSFDIPSENNFIVRPLLNFSRDQILNYLKAKKQSYREDSSNSKEVYTRNYIRLNVIPVFKKINPSLDESVFHILNNLHDLEIAAELSLSQFEKHCLEIKNNCLHIHPHGNFTESVFASVFRLWLNNRGFDRKTIDKIIACRRSGAIFKHGKNQLIVDRKGFILKTDETHSEIKKIPVHIQTGLQTPIRLKIKVKEKHEVKSDRKKNYLYLDADKIKQELFIRKWQTGDRFSPFGMKGTKKLSDFYTQEKMNAVEKSNQWLLCCGNEIIWVIGRRASSHFAMDAKTKKVLEIKLKDE